MFTFYVQVTLIVDILQWAQLENRLQFLDLMSSRKVRVQKVAAPRTSRYDCDGREMSLFIFLFCFMHTLFYETLSNWVTEFK